MNVLPRKETNGVYVYLCEKYKGLSYREIHRQNRLKGMFNVGVNYVVLSDGTVVEGLGKDKTSDILFEGHTDNIIVLVADTSADMSLIKQIAGELPVTFRKWSD